ncbi:MAG: CBS domain-containing protein [Candidatus Peregrinibacteria bacterium]
MIGKLAHIGTENVTYFTDVLGTKVIANGKKIGRLSDMIIVENEHLPNVTFLHIRRSFGNPALLIPWERVKVFGNREIVVHIEDVRSFEDNPAPGDILLKDHILDKKVIDVEDRDVEVVYDVKLILRNNVLFVSDVNISRYRLLRRLGLKWLAKALTFLRKDLRDEKIPWTFIQPLPPAIGSFRGDVKLKVLKEKLSEIHPAELADILEELDESQRLAVFSELETSHASDTLEEIDPAVQRDLVAALKKERVALLLGEMTTGQAADILSVLPATEARAILKLLRSTDQESVKKIEAILSKQEEKIANFTTPKLIDLPDTTVVRDALPRFLTEAKDRDVVMYLYVIDANNHLVGVMNLKELLRAEPEKTLRSIMLDNVIKLSPDATLRDALSLFSRYEYRAIPVVDRDGHLLGVVPHRDVMQLKHRFFD